MFPKIDPTGTQAWHTLEQHASTMKQVRIKELFAQDAGRFKKWGHRFNDILIDFSKNIISDETKKLLLQLTEEPIALTKYQP